MLPYTTTAGSEASTTTPHRIRVAIVGGGCAGMTTAFELTRPEHRQRYDVTVYQMGFRLGGKGASGRGVGGRIEEHGLHVWMGFYENAFRLMRECYRELERDPRVCPVATWQDAFKPAPHVAVTDRLPDGGWEAWAACFPGGAGLPGDPWTEHNPFSVKGYLRKSAQLVVELLRAAEAGADKAHGANTSPRSIDAPARSSGRLIEGIEWLLRHGQLATVAALTEAMELLSAALELLPDALRGARDVLLRLSEAIAKAARRQRAMLVQGDASLRRTWQVVDLVLAILRGSLVHGLMLSPQGFDALDDYDWREWLALHGASRESLDSGFMRGIYDLAFAYVEGDPARPSLSAAAALRGAMRMFFTYRGALFWRMSAGMGDIVFAPLYEVLKRRGVRFEFFHRLSEARAADDNREPHVAELHFDVQARVASGSEYQPLVDVHGLPCWPAGPDYTQLVDGGTLEREQRAFESPWETRVAGRRLLRVGRDFDLVVLALGGGAVPQVCQSLIARAPAWREMERGLSTVATQAFQLWLDQDMSSLGYSNPPGNLSGWVEPFDTWADMSHLIPAEDAQVPVRAIAYFCSPLPDRAGEGGADEAFHAAAQRRVRDSAVRFLEREVTALWPGARATAGGFRWELLAVEPTHAAANAATLEGQARFDSQFWTANVRPSDRYTLSLPGTQRQRLSPLDRSFDNLTVAGDWTASGLNTGCVESAVMSGLLAASALSGSPSLDEIIGYDHP